MSEPTCAFDGCKNTNIAARGLCWGHYKQQRKGQELHPLGPRLLLDRIIEKLEVDGDCWMWTGSGTPDGYGHISTPQGTVYVYRAVWEELVGPIPDGMVPDHLCRRHPCCNPDHIEIVTERINILRGYGAPAMNARKTCCKNGHPFDDANTRVDRHGYRKCRTCKREEDRRYKARLKAQAALPSPPLPGPSHPSVTLQPAGRTRGTKRATRGGWPGRSPDAAGATAADGRR